MTGNEIDRLAAAGHALRPDWPAASLRTLLAARHADRAFQDVAVALAFVAADPLTRTPARLDSPGPWWRRPEGGGSTPPRPAEWCRSHPGQWAHACAGCKADELGGPAPAPLIPSPRSPSVVGSDSPGRRAARAAVDGLAGR